METPKLTDSALNALRPTAPLLPLDGNPEDNLNECPPSWPSCGPEPKAGDPAPTSAEPSSPMKQ